MSQGSFTFARDLPVRRVADTSIVAYERLKPLKALDLAWLLKVYEFLFVTGASDVTGGELAWHYQVLATTTRPRLSGCFDRGWLVKGEIRESHALYESECRGYRPVLPRAAVERAQRRAVARAQNAGDANV